MIQPNAEPTETGAHAFAEPTGCLFAHHKARYRDSRCSAEDRIESAHWLLDRGFIGLDGEWLRTQAEASQR